MGLGNDPRVIQKIEKKPDEVHVRQSAPAGLFPQEGAKDDQGKARQLGDPADGQTGMINNPKMKGIPRRNSQVGLDRQQKTGAKDKQPPSTDQPLNPFRQSRPPSSSIG